MIHRSARAFSAVFALGVLAATTAAAPARAGTFVYVSNADDADISTYMLAADSGKLVPGERVPAGKLVMPMAASSNGRFLYAISRSKPFSVYAYRIDPATGALRWLATSPLPDSMVNVFIDRTGRWLLTASYGGGTLAAHAIEADGRIAPDPLQFFPSGGVKPHSLRTDRENRFLYVPHLGSDEVRTYRFDAASGRLSTDAVSSSKLPAGTGPRHSQISNDNRFLYVLTELTGVVLVYQRDPATGALTQIQSIASQPADSKLLPGQARVPVGTPGAIPFDETTAIWSADTQMTPDGRFLYTSERTKGTLTRFGVDTASGKLTWLGLTPTEAQPRGFAIDPSGRYLIASGEKSETISLYDLDPATGGLTLRQQVPVGKGANWVQIVKTD